MTVVVNPLKSVFKPLQGYNPRHPLSFSAFSHSPAKLLSGWFLGFEMAGYWIKFDTSTPDKPEVWAIAENLSIDPDAVVGKLLRVWAWFDDQTEKGNAPSVTKALLDRSVGVSGFCAAMILAGWMLEECGVISIPNFDRHNGSTAKSRCLTASRVAKHKKSNASLTLDALPRREEKRREENKTVSKDTVTGYFEIWYASYPKKIGKDVAARAYAKAVKSIEPSELLEASLPRFAQLAKREHQYIPNPSSWLNSGGWKDDIESITPKAKSSAGPGQTYDPNHNYEDEPF